jgi:hypothetical protein
MKNKPLPASPIVEPATTEEALEFVRGLQKFRKKDDAPVDESAVKEYVNQFSLGTLQSIARRVMMDIMKGPQRGASAPDKAAPSRNSAPKKRAGPVKKKAKPPEQSQRGKATSGGTGPRKRTRER